MDITVKLLPATSQAELHITISPKEFAPYLERAAKKLSQEKPLAGFRPGKVPLTVAVETFGQERIVQTALDAAVPRFFVRAVMEHDIQAINRPSISIKGVGIATPLTFIAVVDVLPEVTLGDFSTIAVERRAVSVSEEEIDQELKHIAKMRSTHLDVVRPAALGDVVTVDFKVTIDGVVIEGGISKNHPIHLGEGYFVPNFETGLLGVRAGEERTFNITFPPDFAKQALRGKQATVWIQAHAVQQRVLPEPNDDFAKKLGNFTSLAHLRTELKKNITREKEHKEQERFHAELNDKLLTIATFGLLPSILIEKEIDHRLEEFSQMLALQHKMIADYLLEHNSTLQQFREGMRASAEHNVKRALALRAFAAQENIAVSDEETQEHLQRYLNQTSSHHSHDSQPDSEELRDRVANLLKNQKALDRLEELISSKTRSN